MKKFILGVLAVMSFIACSDDELPAEQLKGTNKVSIAFDNGFKNDKLLLGSSRYQNSNGEFLTVNAFDYIVSNFVLIDEQGKEFVFNKDKSYFIISEGGAGKTKKVAVDLEGVPAGKYVKIKFGIGVDQERFKQGQAVQQDFWTLAEQYSLTWSWQAGYKFVVLEGDYQASSQATKKPYMLHIASRGTSVDLYKEVTLNMDQAVVSASSSPQIHIKVDAEKMLGGTHKIKLAEGATIMGGDKASEIADNNKEMFTVHHVHHAGHH